MTDNYNARELVTTVRSMIRQEYNKDTKCQSFQMVVCQDQDQDGADELYQAIRKREDPKRPLSCASNVDSNENENEFANLPMDTLRGVEPSFREMKSHFKKARRSQNSADLSNLMYFDLKWSQM